MTLKLIGSVIAFTGICLSSQDLGHEESPKRSSKRFSAKITTVFSPSFLNDDFELHLTDHTNTVNKTAPTKETTIIDKNTEKKNTTKK